MLTTFKWCVCGVSSVYNLISGVFPEDNLIIAHKASFKNDISYPFLLNVPILYPPVNTIKTPLVFRCLQGV